MRMSSMNTTANLDSYGPEHNLWQDNVENCEQLVKDYWASKPESERLVVLLIPPTRASAPTTRAHALGLR